MRFWQAILTASLAGNYAHSTVHYFTWGTSTLYMAGNIVMTGLLWMGCEKVWPEKRG